MTARPFDSDSEVVVRGIVRHRARRDEGAAALEFAIVLPVLLLLLLGMIEFGYAYQAQLAVTHAAREGARFAAVHTDSEWNPALIASRAHPLTIADGLAISKTSNATAVTVTVRFPYRFRFIPDWGGRTVNLSSSATMRRE